MQVYLAIETRRLSLACQILGGLISFVFASIAVAANPLDPIIAREQQKSEAKLTLMPVVSDAVFLRRIYVDLIGRIPTAAEVTNSPDSLPKHDARRWSMSF